MPVTLALVGVKLPFFSSGFGHRCVTTELALTIGSESFVRGVFGMPVMMNIGCRLMPCVLMRTCVWKRG